jgi:formylglycine-generating enzyme required for sulfatase activity/serine/threonine protein kinase
MSDRETFGPFQVVEEIADEPMARICRAVHIIEEQKVILHILHPAISKNPQIRTVLEELSDPHSSRRIVDPAVVRVVDTGNERGHYYIAYEDFGGVPLNKYLKQERPALRKGLNLAVLIAESVRAIHARRMVHGDLKPDNILIGRTRDNRLVVKIATVDLAHATSSSGISVSGELVGTPKFMSPEQIEGKRAGFPSDIFALGIIFYEMFSGREPFPSQGPLGYVRANVQSQHAPLSQAETTAPADLSRVIDRMLTKSPTARYRRADALLDDLERVEARLEGHRVGVQPHGTDSAFASHAHINHASPNAWRAVAITALAMSVLLFAAVLWLIVNAKGSDDAIVKKSNPRTVDTGVEEQPPIKKPITKPPTNNNQQTQNGNTSPEKPTPRTDSLEAQLERALALARDRADKGKFDEAKVGLDMVAKKFSDPVYANKLGQTTAYLLVARAAALADGGKTQEALVILKNVARDYPSTKSGVQAPEQAAAILNRVARDHEDAGKLTEAITAYEGVVGEYPKTAVGIKATRHLTELRIAYAASMSEKDIDRAIAVLTAAAASKDKNAAATARKALGATLLTRARSLLKKGDLVQCQSDLNKAMTADPELAGDIKALEPELLYRQVVAFRDSGDFEKALEALNLLRKGEYQGKRYHGRAEGAMRETLKRLGPDFKSNANALLKFAREKEEAGDMEAARALYEKTARRFPDTPEGKEALDIVAYWATRTALGHWVTGDFETGGKLLKKVVDDYPKAQVSKLAQAELTRHKNTPKGMAYIPAAQKIELGLDAAQAKQIATQYKMPPTMAKLVLQQHINGKVVNVRYFYIDRTEVTNAQYKVFMDATKAAAPRSPMWNTLGGSIKKDYEQFPVTGVTWHEAAAYAKWADKRLPTEAEWELAGRGTDGRLFPWGNTFEAGRATILFGQSNSKVARPAKVGALPGGHSPYGVADLVGNAREWTADTFKSLGIKTKQRVIRGASWLEMQRPYDAFLTNRWSLEPDKEHIQVGFRCARNAPEKP